MLRLVRDQYRSMPWKNGGGTTREILISPPRTERGDGFDYRVSLADVRADGPFSTFPGCDRHLVVVGGAGMRLDVGGRALALRPFVPVAFSGDDATYGTLTEGPVRDFNVIVDRERVRASVACVEVHRRTRFGPADGEVWVLHVARGGTDVAGEEDTLVLDGDVELAPSTERADVIVVRLKKTAP